MEHKQTTGPLTIWGCFNIISPLPLLLFTSFLSLLIILVFGFRSESPVVLGISLLPALIHPVSCIAAFVRALQRWKHDKRDSILCAVLTAIGAAENILLWIFLVHRTSVG